MGDQEDLGDFLDNLDAPAAAAEPAPGGESAADPLSDLDLDAAPEAAPKPVALPPADPEKIKPFDDYLEQLLKAANLDMQAVSAVRDSILRLNKDAVKLENPTDDNRKIVRTINKSFWNLYYNLAINQLEAKAGMGRFRLFFQFGMTDEKLVTPEVRQFLHLSKDPTEGKIPVFTFFQWLELLFAGTEMPCLNELGIDYVKFQRDLEKSMSTRDKEAHAQKPEAVKARERVKYEIDNMILSVTRMMPSSFPQALTPLLQKNHGPLPASLVTAERIRAAVEEIRSYDFSIFYRETLFRYSSTSNDIVVKEVEPYFIILPVCGDKVVFWQEVSGTKKTTRGRIFVPMFFMGDLRRSMLKALAQYRWELNRNIKGTLWQDPVEGGITGAFYDYVTFYRKNSKLTPEAKEKLEQVIRDNRKDSRRVFTLFYYTWIDFERKGIMRLDKVSREIFFRYMPFPKAIRDELGKLPAYADLQNRYNIITNREILRIENRYKKYKDTHDGKYPPEIQETLNFYRN